MALFIAALVILFIVRVVDVLLLVFVAILLAVYLSAITDWLEQRRFGLRRWMGLLTAVLATIIIIAGVAVLLVPPVIDQTEALIGACPKPSRKSRTCSRAGRDSIRSSIAPSLRIRHRAWLRRSSTTR